jgi:hypothetical protein
VFGVTVLDFVLMSGFEAPRQHRARGVDPERRGVVRGHGGGGVFHRLRTSCLE